MLILEGFLTWPTDFLSDLGLGEVGPDAEPDCDWLT